NDTVTFAALLPSGPVGDVTGLAFTVGEAADWYAVVPASVNSALGFAGRAYLDPSMIAVLAPDGTQLPRAYVNVLPATRDPDGSFRFVAAGSVPSFYAIQVLNLERWTIRLTPVSALLVGTATFDIKIDGGATIRVSVALNTTGKTGTLQSFL